MANNPKLAMRQLWGVSKSSQRIGVPKTALILSNSGQDEEAHEDVDLDHRRSRRYAVSQTSDLGHKFNHLSPLTSTALLSIQTQKSEATPVSKATKPNSTESHTCSPIKANLSASA